MTQQPVFQAARSALMAAVFLFPSGPEARKWDVGPGKTHLVPSAVADLVKDGDTVEIAPGVYSKDVAVWRANGLTLRATARYAHLKADGAEAKGKGTWVIMGHDAVIENIEFSGAKVADENGAGIRQEGRNPIIRNCYFHDNENGILTDGGDSHILIENSEFHNNGFGDGFTHNMYIGPVKRFTLRGSFSHHARIGHNVKSRAEVNHILHNRITDDVDGTASYNIDLPNGGVAYIIGNVLQQSPRSDNPTLISWGAEGLKYAANAVYISHNTLVNDRQGGTFVSLSGVPTTAKAVNNLFVGPGTLFSGKLDTAGNIVTQAPGFVDRAAFDYRLTEASPAIDRGKDPGSADSISLAPALEYAPPYGTGPRAVNGPLDAGAFEFSKGSGIRAPVKKTPGGSGLRGNSSSPFFLIEGVAESARWVNSLGKEMVLKP